MDIRYDDADVVHALPDQWSDDRAHVVDAGCWCAPRPLGSVLVHDSVDGDV